MGEGEKRFEKAPKCVFHILVQVVREENIGGKIGELWVHDAKLRVWWM